MKIRNALVWVLCVLMLLSFAGCSVARDNVSGNGMSGDLIVKEEVSLDKEASEKLPDNRKLIQTVNMQAETENLDTVLGQIDSRIAQLGGYVESSNVQNGSAYSSRRYRSASLTIRIPAEDLDAFIDQVGEISNIVSSQKNVEDVTLSYVATESRMKALQAEEARLLELIEKAETLNDLLTLDKRLTEVRTELEQVTSALRVFDNQVDYATIYLSISEVKEFTDTTEPETIWERISTGFQDSLKGVGDFFVELFVAVVVSIPYLVIVAIIPVVIVLIIRSKKRKKMKKTENEDQQEDS